MKRVVRIVFFILIIGVTAGGLLTNSTLKRNVVDLFSNKTSISSKIIGDGIKASGKVTDHSSYSGVDLITEIEEGNAYYMSIHYPEFKDSSLNNVIKEYISTSKQDFLSEVNTNKVHFSRAPATLYILLDIFPVTEDIYSIVLNNESYVNGANGSQSSQVFLIDTEDGSFIEQTEILIDNRENRDQLYQLLLDAFEQSEDYQPFFSEDQLKSWIEDEEEIFSKIYLTDNSFVFKFDKYQVTAGAAGSPEIEILFEEIVDLITDEWQDRLGFDNQEEEVTEVSGESGQSDEQLEKDTDKDTTNHKKRVALTFDDGPHPSNTIEILQLLEDYDAKATFFVLGSRVDFYPDLTKEIAARGHELGNHTWNHKDLTALNKEEINQEIQLVNDRIEEITGQSPTLYRAPYGARNDLVREVVDLTEVMWTIDTEDWRSHDPDKILSIVKENITDGSIILMHDIHDTTVEATKLVLKFLQEEGYTSVTVSELNSY